MSSSTSSSATPSKTATATTSTPKQQKKKRSSSLAGNKRSRSQILQLLTLRPLRQFITHRIFYPNTEPDTSTHLISNIPLPKGSLGCPFKGSNTKLVNKSYGRGYFYKLQSQRLKNPTIFKCYEQTTKTPSVVLVGTQLIKSILKQEFTLLESNLIPFTKKIVGSKSLRMIQDKNEHTTIRQLVSKSVDKDAIVKAIPMLQTSAVNVINDNILQALATNSSLGCVNVTMIDLCHEYTLQIAWRQLLGLELSKDEIPTFHQAVIDWIGGLYRVDLGLQARKYLEEIINSRIDELEQLGPNSFEASSSTLGRMVFATIDDDDAEDDSNGKNATTFNKKRCLTREEIIDNSFLLILAGTDTSAGTLTAAMAMIGLQQQKQHGSSVDENESGAAPHSISSPWEKLVQEQIRLKAKFGGGDDGDDDFATLTYTKEMLDETECPYLDGVVKEALRLAPASTNSARGTKKTIIVDTGNGGTGTRGSSRSNNDDDDGNSVQIPKGWGVYYNRWLTHRSDPITMQPNDLHMDWYHGFVPERWMGSSDGKPTPSEFIPFGAGPRYCIGSELAMIEMKIFLATLASSNITFELLNYGPNAADATSNGNNNKRQKKQTTTKVTDGMDMYTKSLIPYPYDGVQVTMTTTK